MRECYIRVCQHRDPASSNLVLRIPRYCVITPPPISLRYALVFSIIYHDYFEFPAISN